MIESIAHKGLRMFFEEDNPSKLPAHLLERIRDILSLLDTAETIAQLDVPGYRLHKLAGNYRDFYSVRVSGNYRIIFRFVDGKVFDINYIDYH